MYQGIMTSDNTSNCSSGNSFLMSNLSWHCTSSKRRGRLSSTWFLTHLLSLICKSNSYDNNTHLINLGFSSFLVISPWLIKWHSFESKSLIRASEWFLLLIIKATSNLIVFIITIKERVVLFLSQLIQHLVNEGLKEVIFSCFFVQFHVINAYFPPWHNFENFTSYSYI